MLVIGNSVDDMTKEEIKPVYFEHYGDIAFFIFEPFLEGEDYPVLTRLWNNEEDEVYDS